jgi:Zn-dependent protease
VLVGAPSRGIWEQIFITTSAVNLGFFVFNIIPIPPLDGSRILYALAPDFFRRGMEAMEKFGIVIIFLLVLLSGAALETFMSNSINFFLNIFSHIFGV